MFKFLLSKAMTAKNSTLATTFVLPDVNLFVIALNNILICQHRGRGKGHVA